MDYFLIIISLLFMILGIIGSFLPILPGPFTSWVGLLILHFTSVVPMNTPFLMITFCIALVISFLDYIIPVIGTKRFGGSKMGIIGTSMGLIVGLIAPIPGGIIIGPFLGALFGELLNKSDIKSALKAAFGSFLGFITSTFLKFIVSIIYFGFFLIKLFDSSDLFI